MPRICSLGNKHAINYLEIPLKRHRRTQHVLILQVCPECSLCAAVVSQAHNALRADFTVSVQITYDRSSSSTSSSLRSQSAFVPSVQPFVVAYRLESVLHVGSDPPTAWTAT